MTVRKYSRNTKKQLHGGGSSVPKIPKINIFSSNFMTRTKVSGAKALTTAKKGAKFIGKSAGYTAAGIAGVGALGLSSAKAALLATPTAAISTLYRVPTGAMKTTAFLGKRVYQAAKLSRAKALLAKAQKAQKAQTPTLRSQYRQQQLGAYSFDEKIKKLEDNVRRREHSVKRREARLNKTNTKLIKAVQNLSLITTIKNTAHTIKSSVKRNAQKYGKIMNRIGEKTISGKLIKIKTDDSMFKGIKNIGNELSTAKQRVQKAVMLPSKIIGESYVKIFGNATDAINLYDKLGAKKKKVKNTLTQYSDPLFRKQQPLTGENLLKYKKLEEKETKIIKAQEKLTRKLTAQSSSVVEKYNHLSDNIKHMSIKDVTTELNSLITKIKQESINNPEKLVELYNEYKQYTIAAQYLKMKEMGIINEQPGNSDV
jgi:hypothetical protein